MRKKCAGRKTTGETAAEEAETVDTAGEAEAAGKVTAAEALLRASEKVCPDCGMSEQIFADSHRLGCPRCYDVFAEEVAALLPGIQRGDCYRGDAAPARVPVKRKKNSAEKLSLAALRERLKTAVSQENYVLAARLRDEIRAAEAASACEKNSPASAEKKNDAEYPRGNYDERL